MKEKRSQFGTKLGVIMVTAGSAVGLGNIWRFPYEVGANGGGAFVLLYLIFVFFVGLPVICGEFILGKRSRSGVRGAFEKLHKSRFWGSVGYISILAAVLIMGFYSVVASWTMEYIVQSVEGFSGLSSPEDFHDRFELLTATPVRPVVWTSLFLLLNYLILIRGVEKGIEKVSNLMMPLLFILLIAFSVNSLLLPGAGEGLRFLFHPDFSKLTGEVVLRALGQAFFSLSLGMGCLVTYSSYFKPETPLMRTGISIAVLDTFVAVMAGVMIFPAVFTYGQEPAAGPRLVFEVLPMVFSNMPSGSIWSLVFFVLLFLAALTSIISVSEIIIAYLMDDFGMSRFKACTVHFVISLVFGVVCALSFSSLSDFKIFGFNVFDLFDYVSSNILMPLGGMLLSIFVGWVIKRSVVKEELLAGTSKRGVYRVLATVMGFCLRYVAPVAIAIVMLNCLKGS